MHTWSDAEFSNVKQTKHSISQKTNQRSIRKKNEWAAEIPKIPFPGEITSLEYKIFRKERAAAT